MSATRRPELLQLFHQPLLTFQIIWDNFLWSCREFQRATLVGFLSLFLFDSRWDSHPPPDAALSVYWIFGASLGSAWASLSRTGSRGSTYRLVFPLALSGLGRFYALVMAAG